MKEWSAVLGDTSGARTLAAVDEALSARVLEEVAGAPGRVQFSHALIRETLLEEMSAARRAHLAAGVLAALEELYGPAAPCRAPELLHHAEEADDADACSSLRPRSAATAT